MVRLHRFLATGRLSAKILHIVVVVSLLGVLFASAVVFAFQRQQLIDKTQESSARLTETIEASLRYAMQRNDWTTITQTIWGITSDQRAGRIRILNPAGVVLASSIPTEIGQRVDRNDANCQACHASSSRAITLQRIITSYDRGETLVNVSLIRNVPSCQGCHDPRVDLLGILVIETPLAELNQQLMTVFWLMALTAIISFVLLVGMMAPALRRLILRPIGELSRGIVEIRTGNLDYPVQVNSADEIGDLAQAFDGMRLQLKASRAEMERHEQETIALHRLMMKVSASLDLERVLHDIADGARQILRTDLGAVAVLDEQRQQLALKALCGSSTQPAPDWIIPLGTDIGTGALEQPMVLTDPATNLPFPEVGEFMSRVGITSLMSVPLWRSGRLYGLVAVMSRQPRQFSRDDIQLLLRLVVQVSIAIDNAELYRQARRVATLEERDRLAKELHDSLAQKLGYLNVQASITSRLLSGDDNAKALASLEDMRQIAKDAFADVREGIFNLKNMTSSDLGLVPALKDYMERYCETYGLEAELVVQEGYQAHLPAEAEVQITRIVQEALANVRKHSGARQARVLLVQEDHHVQITVADDGLGFDLDQVMTGARSTFGLQIMRERAESIGGQFSVVSQSGQGTRICVQVPFTS